MNFIGLIFIFTVTSSAVGHRRHYPGTGTNENVQDGEDEYGNRGGWHNGRAAAAQSIIKLTNIKKAIYSMPVSDCSTSTSVNSYCDQVLESLLSLVVGVPDSNNITNNSFSEILSKSYPNQISANATQKDKEKSNIQRQGIAENSNVTQVNSIL